MLNSTDSFEKIYVFDTNIALSDVKNIEILSQNSSNLLVFPETMLDEMDAKKSGFEEINFMAREFGRLLESAEVIDITKDNGVVINRCYIKDKNIVFEIISKDAYEADKDKSIERNVLNDRKIIEIASYVANVSKFDTIFISLDVMCRQRALSLGLKTESFGKYNELNIEFFKEYDLSELNLNSFPSSLEINCEKSISGVCLYDSYGDRKYYVKSGILFHLINEEELKRQNIKPMNMQQKIMSTLMTDSYYDVVAVDAQAGTGKTLIALSAAMKLIDQKMSPYDKIVYIRKTIISSDTELGFLPGTLEEKMMGYLAPLYSNLEAIALQKYGGGKKKFSEEEMKQKIDDLISDYRITPMWQGHLRGATIRNAIVIYDEIQNDNISDIRTTLTRMGENCKVFCLGSLRQIDNKYVNRHTSALTYLLAKINDDNIINIAGATLTNTVRSKLAEWADEFK